MSKKVVLFILLINIALYLKINSSDEINEIPNLSRPTIQVPQRRELDFYHNQVPSPEEKKQNNKRLNFSKKEELGSLEYSDEDYSINPIRKKRCILQSSLPRAKRYESYSDSEYSSYDTSDSEFEEKTMSPASKKHLLFLETVEYLLRSNPSASSSSTINTIDSNSNTQLHLLASRALFDEDRNKVLEDINKALHYGADTLQKNKQGLTPLQLFRHLQLCDNSKTSQS